MRHKNNDKIVRRFKVGMYLDIFYKTNLEHYFSSIMWSKLFLNNNLERLVLPTQVCVIDFQLVRAWVATRYSLALGWDWLAISRIPQMFEGCHCQFTYQPNIILNLKKNKSRHSQASWISKALRSLINEFLI